VQARHFEALELPTDYKRPGLPTDYKSPELPTDYKSTWHANSTCTTAARRAARVDPKLLASAHGKAELASSA